MLLVCIAIGGAFGALARYGLAGWVHGWAGASLPWGTLTVNVLGSLLLGFLMRALDALAAPAELRGLLAVGLLGAFTTFSTFSYETVALVQDGAWARAAVYALGSVAAGLAGVLLGLGVAGLLFRQSG